ncbi:MAG: response regulator [Planctomycetaceae bacterium]|nr:response regulator [Planctomycetaceae bacterium]
MPDAQRILLIEDDREIASTLLSVLNAAGYQVQHAPNGIEGRRIIEQSRPDLVITDMMMPKMGGFPVLEFLKDLPNPPKVIMITANEGGRHKAYAEMLGVADYLRKPFAMDVMLESIERIIGPPPADGGGGVDPAVIDPPPTGLKARRTAKKKPAGE